MRAGVARNAVQRWLKATAKPEPARRQQLQELFGIPVEAWEREPPPREPPPSEQAEQAEQADEAPAVAPVVPVGGDTFSSVARLQTQIDLLLNEVEHSVDTTPIERSKVMQGCSAALERLARIRGDYDLGRRLLKLPIWLRIREVIGDALRPYPAAADATADALSLLDRELRNEEPAGHA